MISGNLCCPFSLLWIFLGCLLSHHFHHHLLLHRCHPLACLFPLCLSYHFVVHAQTQIVFFTRQVFSKSQATFFRFFSPSCVLRSKKINFEQVESVTSCSFDVGHLLKNMAEVQGDDANAAAVFNDLWDNPER